MKCSFTYSVNNEEHWGVGGKQCGHLNVLISGGGSIQFQVLTLLSAQPWVYLLASLLFAPAFKQSFPFPSRLNVMGWGKTRQESAVQVCLLLFSFYFSLPVRIQVKKLVRKRKNKQAELLDNLCKLHSVLQRSSFGDNII